MKLRRIAPTVGLCLALVVGSSIAYAEPTEPDPSPSDPTPTAEPTPTPSQTQEPTPDPEPEPEPSPTPTPTPSSTTPSPTPSSTTPSPTPSSTSTPKPTATSSPTSTPTGTATGEPTLHPRPTSTPTTTTPSNPWSTSPNRILTPMEPEPLSKTAIALQLEQADKLLASLSAGNAKLAALLAELDELTTAANEALEAKAAADSAAAEAAARARQSRETAARMAEELEHKHQMLKDWAFSAYAGGGWTAEMVSVFDALLTDPEKAGNPVGDLTYLTEQRITLFADIRRLTDRQAEVAKQAEADAELTRTTAAAAREAKAKADEALEAQKAVIAKAEAEQVEVLVNAAPMAAMLLGMASPEAKARGQAIVDALMERNVDLPDIDKPCSNDTKIYANGQLPASALCPLWQAPGHYARPDAAVAFNALSQKFARDLGRPICVTSSYRSFSQQVAVKARRGFWAATPGYSQHGFGKALDLCGGINDFGTIEHLWMKQNAPLFGWFHPSWARAGGNKPEPWHWEYAG